MQVILVLGLSNLDQIPTANLRIYLPEILCKILSLPPTLQTMAIIPVPLSSFKVVKAETK